MPVIVGRNAQEYLDEARSSVRRALGIAFVVSGLFNILQLALPVYSMQIFDRVLVSGSLSTLALLTVMLVLATVCSSILDWVRGLLLSAAASEVDLALSRSTLSRRTNSRSHDALRDVDVLRSFMGGAVAVAFLDAPWALAFVLAMFVLHFVLGFITIAALSLMLCFAWFGDAASRSSSRALAAPADQMKEVLGELQAAGELSELPGSRRALTKQLLQLRALSAQAIHKFSARRSWIDASARGIRALAQVVIFAATAVLVVGHDIQTGAILASSLLFQRAVGPFERIAASMQALVAARAAWCHVAPQSERASAEAPKLALPRIAGELTVSDVAFRLPGRHQPFLYRLNFKVAPGTVTTIFGAEGAGKSTLARLLIGALAPMTGEIRVDGSKLTDFDPEELGRQVGYLAQSTHLGTGTVSQIIAGVREPDPEAVVVAARLTGVHARIQTFTDGYQTRLGDGMFQPSAGERQRIALARAVFGFPRLVILDEPTTGLDDTAESAVIEVITALKAAGSTVVVISRLPALLQLSDQMFMLGSGTAHPINLEKLVSSGPRIVASNR